MTCISRSRDRSLGAWLAVAFALVAASCGGGDDDGVSSPGTTEASEIPADISIAAETDTVVEAAVDTDAAIDTDSPATDGSDAGTLILGSEIISFDSVRCVWEEQDALIGGGKVLFEAKALGVDANGDELVADVLRMDEDNNLTGDHIIVGIGDPFSDAPVAWMASVELGMFTISGSTVSADGLTFQNRYDLSELEGSFSINC